MKNILTKELPFVPLEKDIDQLIGIFSDSKYGALLQLFKETAFKPSEGMNLRVRDVDLEKGIVTLNNPLKGSNARQAKLSPRLVAMLIPQMKGRAQTIHCQFAKTIEEVQESIENGFEFITDYEGKKIFRKRN